jgi:mono/diheme cytochrome c family protein
MERRHLAWFLVVLPVLMAAPGVAAAQETVETFAVGDSGSSVFKTYCGACHGTAAKGDGPLAGSLRKRPPDLTRLAKRNGGVFDADKIHRIIDGRQPVKGHGGPDMPVWGDAFGKSGSGGERAVKGRIDALVEFLRSVQVETAR